VSEVRKIIEAKAIARAVASGAALDRVSIVESEVIPIAYTTGRCRFYVKAAGDWSGNAVPDEIDDVDSSLTPSSENTVAFSPTSDAVPEVTSSLDSPGSIISYTPRVKNNQWFLSEIDLEWISDGCYVLGCGGGGSPLHVFLEIREMVRAGAVIRVVDSGSLTPDALIGWGGALGSPEVCSERLLGNEYVCPHLQDLLGNISTGTTKRVLISGRLWG
jgi:hypothetical protein